MRAELASVGVDLDDLIDAWRAIQLTRELEEVKDEPDALGR